MEPGLREEKKKVDSETVSVWMCLDWGGRRLEKKKKRLPEPLLLSPVLHILSFSLGS